LGAPIPRPLAPFRRTYAAARTLAHDAVLAFDRAVVAHRPLAALGPLLAAARAATVARDAARANMVANGVPAGVTAAAQAMDAGTDALLAAAQLLSDANQQIPIFAALAARFGFGKFSDYARRSAGDDEWFAETYALFVTDPDRLNQMSRNIFLWFEAGMPMDRNWNPAQ
jgi:hypothetical protein